MNSNKFGFGMMCVFASGWVACLTQENPDDCFIHNEVGYGGKKEKAGKPGRRDSRMGRGNRENNGSGGIKMAKLLIEPVETNFKQNKLQSLYHLFTGGGNFRAIEGKTPKIQICTNHPIYDWEGVLVHELQHYNIHLEKKRKKRKAKTETRLFPKIKAYWNYFLIHNSPEWEEAKCMQTENEYEKQHNYTVYKKSRIVCVLFMITATTLIDLLFLAINLKDFFTAIKKRAMQ